MNSNLNSESQAVLLGVNIDHVATIRQARGTRYPDPVQAAIEVEQAGADLVTLHLREDRRHIQERDVELIQQVVLTRMNLEMAVTDSMLSIAERIAPTDCCLVPERREELTTEGGLDVSAQVSKVKDACARLKNAGIKASLFIDADRRQIDAAVETSAPCIEIHTGHFADANSEVERARELQKVISAVQYAMDAGLQVNAGHGLNYQNVRQIAKINGIAELNIGHSIVARALFTGLQKAVREMSSLIRQSRMLD